ncbi:hypothetical protein BOTBODRAFT_196201 [Botryobasidium botryosum FD-172 SS1]|uniref:CLASP N-terminal domain-containing protein n=1 Tax=Botryobasidium botryosum (strain FD-172 SS1) TaxID=930990 RepID=A0A067N037_BOTB1|nr:hypothetical protein BOTBODRAFT_196201 [Botryobasidium botryosum FD-172 SS1]
MQRALFRLTAVTRGGAYKLDPQFADGMRWLSKWINNCMLSERARLSGAATDLVTVFAPRLGTRFDPLMGIFVPTLLKLCARTNKLFITRAHTCLSRILETTRLTRVLPMLRDALGDKSQSLRLAATELTAVFVEYWVKCEGDRMKTRWVEDIEVIIKVSARDSNPDIRKTSRRLFESYKLMCPDRIPE